MLYLSAREYSTFYNFSLKQYLHCGGAPCVRRRGSQGRAGLGSHGITTSQGAKFFFNFFQVVNCFVVRFRALSERSHRVERD